MTCLHHLHRRSRLCRPQQHMQILFCMMTLISFTMTAVRAAAAEYLLSETTTSSANFSMCTRSKHVVLASFGEPEAYHTVALYFASKFPDTAVHHLVLHLGQDTASKDTARRKTTDWRMFYQSHGIHRSVVDMSSLEDYRVFRQNYVHSSINDYEYELLCFARFIGLRAFCTSKGIDQLTWIDADIPIFDSNFLDKVCLPRGYSTWALTGWSSFLSTMTCSDIVRFVDFMLDFFARENRHAMVRAIHAHGSEDMAGAPHISEQVHRAEPAFAELGIDPKHFSDMFLFSKFLQDTNKATDGKEEQKNKKSPSMSQVSLPEKIPAPTQKAYIHQVENNGTIDPYFFPVLSIRHNVLQPDNKNLCIDETVWNKYYSVRDDDLGAEKKRGPSAMTLHSGLGLSFNQSGTWVPIAGAHFQGSDCKARLLNLFHSQSSRKSRRLLFLE